MQQLLLCIIRQSDVTSPCHDDARAENMRASSSRANNVQEWRDDVVTHWVF